MAFYRLMFRYVEISIIGNVFKYIPIQRFVFCNGTKSQISNIYIKENFSYIQCHL